jgi:hypothetical protein
MVRVIKMSFELQTWFEMCAGGAGCRRLLEFGPLPSRWKTPLAEAIDSRVISKQVLRE